MNAKEVAALKEILEAMGARSCVHPNGKTGYSLPCIIHDGIPSGRHVCVLLSKDGPTPPGWEHRRVESVASVGYTYSPDAPRTWSTRHQQLRRYTHVLAAVLWIYHNSDAHSQETMQI